MIVVAKHNLCLQAFQHIGQRSKVILNNARSKHLALLITTVARYVGRHFSYSVLFKVKAIIIEHGARLISIGRKEHALSPIVAYDVS